MQVSQHRKIDERLIDERSRVGPAYLKLWHQGIRRLFDACCLMYDKTPDELCDVMSPLMIKKGISPDDMATIRSVLLRHTDLDLEAGKRMARRYEGQTPLIDCLAELIDQGNAG